ncbi:zinc transporter ZIP13 homolog [Vespa mandarinia]|uniref:zinc transporter ZIP13 homolog n=1 Tax=Vespa mandarinia TaxID=7446 RepID=UPI00161DE9A7|nr:zinc transporter ZIP13 homolog [Vespa mandarinia]XP_035737993.1 zinc transporter ZIP13 homolog [Vespa mandarinia]
MAVNMCARNCTEDTAGFIFKMIYDDISLPWNEYSYYITYNPWFFSILGSTMVGLAGVLPLLIIPIEEGADLKNGASAGTLKLLLSFAVGGLLGDVFLHLLPEAWENDLLKRAENSNPPSMPCGLWVLTGFLVFVIVEKIFAFDYDPEEQQADDNTNTSKNIIENFETDKEEMENNNCINLIGIKQNNGYVQHCTDNELLEMEPFLENKLVKNGYMEINSNGVKKPKKNGYLKSEHTNGIVLSDNMSVGKVSDCLKSFTKNNGLSSSSSSLLNGCIIDRKCVSSKTKEKVTRQTVNTVVQKTKSKHIAGYLNLMANCIDNFTHGLAVGGSFLMSFRLGALTTFAILVHEIPHEVGDFAILLRSGFSRWDAARAQLLTATGGIFGSLAAIIFSGGEVEARTGWILPFTAGGFLHIGLVTILPELLKESSPKESLKQLAALLFGVMLMAILTILCD